MNFTHRKNSGLLIEVDGVHDDEDLLVLVGEPGVGLLERGLAVVLHPAVLAEEGGGQPQRQPELERETVDTRGEEDRHSACDWSKVRMKGSDWSIRKYVCVYISTYYLM